MRLWYANDRLGHVVDWLAWKVSRVRCRLFRRHAAHCRGRVDHVRNGQIIDPARWS